MQIDFPQNPESLSDWLTFIEGLNVKPINLGLERMKRMIERLHIRFDCPVFTVAGTNGKGSTCAMLDAILRNAGYRVGTHTSPHLIRFNERALINGIEVDDGTIVEALKKVNEAREDLKLSYFEFTGLAILKIFSDAKLDAVILEIGLGGRLDGMNAIDTSCGIVCALGIDHQAYLGDTREAIAFEKAGIYRSGRPAICTDREAPVTLKDHAARIGAPLSLYGRDFETHIEGDSFDFEMKGKNAISYKALPHPALAGSNQFQNAAGVLAALSAMREKLPVTREAIEKGLTSVRLTARFETVDSDQTGGIETVLDVGHNPQAATVLLKNVLDWKKEGERVWAVYGMLKDKDMRSVAQTMRPAIDRWFVASLTGPRAATSSELVAAMKSAGVEEKTISEFPSVEVALKEALFLARKEPSRTVKILIFGSFVTVSAAIVALEKK